MESMPNDPARSDEWPRFVTDQWGNEIYLTWERWDHALGHPGMDDGSLATMLETLRRGVRKRDAFDSAKFKYSRPFDDLPEPYTDVVVVVKFGWRGDPPAANNFVLTAYLIEKW